jgi:hypothetical protein
MPKISPFVRNHSWALHGEASVALIEQPAAAAGAWRPGLSALGTFSLRLMAEQQAPSNDELPPRETCWHDRADSFASAPLLGRVYRMYAASPEFGALGHCCVEGVSVLVFPDGSGRLLVSKTTKTNGGGRAVRHATMPLRLKGADYEAQGQLGIELIECAIYGEAGPASASEARKIVNDFGCELVSDDGGSSDGWELKLYPCLGGHSFRYDEEEDGELQTILPSHIMMTTPNCDELGHYLFRPTQGNISAETADAVMAEEVAAWEAILNPPPLAAGDGVRVRQTFQSASDGAGDLSTGLVGTVIEIDEDGDALVDFGASSGRHFVFASDHINLQRIAQGALAEP